MGLDRENPSRGAHRFGKSYRVLTFAGANVQDYISQTRRTCVESKILRITIATVRLV